MVTAGLLLAFACGDAQTSKPAKKCKSGSKDPACTADSSTPSGSSSSGDTQSPASANPFPIEDSLHGANADGEPSSTPQKPASNPNGLPAMPTEPVPDPPASSERPMHLPPSGYSTSGDSSSSSSGDSSSSSRPADDDADVAPTTAAPNAPVKAAKLKDLGSRGDLSEARAKLEKTRVADDLKIAKFYWNDGNTQGAYLRYKDAVDHDPGDPDALFGLAEAASKLKKNDEAILNYREYLKADPDGDHDKDVRRALAKLGAPVQ
ncbi:Tetratricopeptide repeat-containing protein [Terriglobus roseus]|uniref:Tetratricopeptide repeat-containing protein n=2 Tax=Terriglobus roseus TaxID=392734 RepID=A0A1H4J4E6_9BACT|nr:Tetratricopeptide repeat-containing protein [Terriglobus roseus]